MAIDCLAGYLYSSKRDGEKVPKPSSMKDIDLAAIAKELDPDYQKPEPQKRYIPPMNHPWRSKSFWRFVKSQEHHLMDDIPA